MPRALPALLLFAAACGGGGSPVAATRIATGVPAGSELLFASGETGQPVADAAVTVADRAYRTDGAGRIRLAAEARLQSLIDVEHSDTLDRQTLLRDAAEARFTLWPRQSPTGLDEDFTNTIVYTRASTTDDGGPFGDRGLQRLPPNEPVAIRPSVELQGDARLMALVDEGVGIINSAVELGLYRVEATPAARVAFSLAFVPEDPDCDDDTYAFVKYSGGGSTINGGRIVFCEPLSEFRSPPASRDLRNYFLGTLTHELGHTFGLGHSTSDRDTMYRRGHWFSYRRSHDYYSRREELVMRLMWQRRAATRFPDNDRQGVGGTARFTELIRD